MTTKTGELRLAAEDLMRQRRFGDAIEAFRMHLERHGRDLKALLELGICHLLNGSEQAFREIHERAGRMLARARKVPADVARLWEQYGALAAKVAATALVLGAMAVEGCKSSHKYSGGVYEANMTQSAHRYSGGVYVQPIPASGPATMPATTSAPASKPAPISSHRYSGGVYVPPIPTDGPAVLPRTSKPATAPTLPPSSGHKYSGGVYKAPVEQG
ncbi:MAG: hypothetical protein ACE15C_06670 [Phycisphaerae bacterium]